MPRKKLLSLIPMNWRKKGFNFTNDGTKQRNRNRILQNSL